MWLEIASAILGGLSSRSKAKKEEAAQKKSYAHERAMALVNAQNDRVTQQHAAELANYYTQKGRHETKRALDGSYKQFSTMPNYAPGYVPGPGLDPLPDMPDATQAGSKYNIPVPEDPDEAKRKAKELAKQRKHELKMAKLNAKLERQRLKLANRNPGGG